jgi:uncharacterized membrane protein
MLVMSLGLVLFFATHLLPTVPAIQHPLQRQIGYYPYKAAFGLISLAGLILIGFGKANAPLIPVWEPTAQTYNLAPGLMLPAFILLVAAYTPSNIKRFVRHPMLWGVLLWALAHLAANGDLASMILFGAFAAYSIVDQISANQRGARKATELRSVFIDVAVVFTGIGLYALFVWLHPVLFNVPALPSSPAMGGM